MKVNLSTALGIAFLLLVMALFVPHRSNLSWIDPMTASFKYQTRFLLVPVSTTVESSAIEDWIRRREGGYTSTWRFLSGSSWMLLSHSNDCGLAPEIYPLRGGLGDEFIRASTDAELAEFVLVMRTGTRVERQAAVDAACEKVLPGHGSGR